MVMFSFVVSGLVLNSSTIVNIVLKLLNADSLESLIWRWPLNRHNAG